MYSEQMHDTLVNSGCNWTYANFNHTVKCGNLADEMFATWNTYFNFYNMFQRSDGTPLFADQNEEGKECVNAIDRPELRAPYRKHSYDYTPWIKASRPTKKTCLGGDALGAYYNSATVRAALNIPTNITQSWMGC
jgi:hypothetical protein